MDLLEQIALCVEKGKVNRELPYPPDMKDKDGAAEFTKKALEEGIPAEDILSKALIVGMEIIGNKFRENKVFVPEVLMSARAMNSSMEFLKPYFLSGEIQRKGVLVIGTVIGDLHDIGKNIVGMMIEGSGWEVIDLGVDVSVDKFMETVDKYPGCFVGLSTLLTTTMLNMGTIVKTIKDKYPSSKIMIGGAPVTQEFCEGISADFYSPDPQGAVDYLNSIVG